jgi:5'-deoxynucleotidase YfbR-like HD superfamily hydrolase
MSLLCINFAELVSAADKKELCYRCSIHDLEESVATDIPRPIKYHSSKTKEVLDEAAFELLKPEVDEDLFNDINHAKDKDDLNGFLVSLADRVQCYMKMIREVEVYGNKSLANDLESFKVSIVDTIKTIDDQDKITPYEKKALKSYICQILKINSKWI